MIRVSSFLVNPFQENTYVLWDDTRECVIIDPGTYNEAEQDEIISYIEGNELIPVKVLNTHCHVDHVFGNRFFTEKYGVGLIMHPDAKKMLDAGAATAKMYGLEYDVSPDPEGYLNEGDDFSFGRAKLEVVSTPGHSPGSICFISREDEMVIVGDVLFLNSIGRTDLPGGDMDTLLRSIHDKLYTLPENFRVYPGHGPATSVGFEKANNPYT